jgi:protein arginine kinase
MNFSDLFDKTTNLSMDSVPHSQIVVSSRVRLARNLHQKPFPGWAKKSERITLMEEM